MTDSSNPIRAWRQARDLSLEAACEMFVARGFPRPSTAKLSRIEREQAIPVDMLESLVVVTGIAARELRPDLAVLFDGEAL